MSLCTIKTTLNWPVKSCWNPIVNTMNIFHRLVPSATIIKPYTNTAVVYQWL